MKKLACLMFLCGPIICWAQSPATGLPAPGTGAPQGTAAPARPNSAGAREVTLAQVRDLLLLTPQQQALWGAFENKVDAYSGTYYRQKPALPSPEDSAPHQIGRMVDNLQNRLAALEDVESAAKTLYASLTPEQQKTANQMLLLTIPTFAPSGSGPSQPAEEARRRGGKPEGSMRPHRAGAAGGMGGGGL